MWQFSRLPTISLALVGLANPGRAWKWTFSSSLSLKMPAFLDSDVCYPTSLEPNTKIPLDTKRFWKNLLPPLYKGSLLKFREEGHGGGCVSPTESCHPTASQGFLIHVAAIAPIRPESNLSTSLTAYPVQVGSNLKDFQVDLWALRNPWLPWIQNLGFPSIVGFFWENEP